MKLIDTKIYCATMAVIIASFFCTEVSAQKKEVYVIKYVNMTTSDTIMVIDLAPIIIRPHRKPSRLYRDPSRLQKAIMVCYPIARETDYLLSEMRRRISGMSNDREVKKYVSEIEKILEKKYTPILRRMSFYQGAVLLKLIDRQTGASGYALLKEMKSGFSAFFWQMVARIYGANLKLQYDPHSTDAVMEKYVLEYEERFGIPHKIHEETSAPIEY